MIRLDIEMILLMIECFLVGLFAIVMVTTNFFIVAVPIIILFYIFSSKDIEDYVLMLISFNHEIEVAFYGDGNVKNTKKT